jgi:hypothetical protein
VSWGAEELQEAEGDLQGQVQVLVAEVGVAWAKVGEGRDRGVIEG